MARKRQFLTYFDPGDRSFLPPDRGMDLKCDPENGWVSRLDVESAGRTADETIRDHTPNEGIRAARFADQLNDFRAAGLRAPAIVDMKDAIRETNEFPCFQYVRKQGAANSILWPLRRVHEIGSSEFCAPIDPSESNLRDKKPVVFWRGIVRGFSTFGGKRTNIKFVLKSYLQNEISRDLVMAHLETVPRYAFVSRYFGKPGFDVGFSQAKRLKVFRQIQEIERFRKDRASHTEHMKYRYQISIEGTDVGTSFGWQLGTNCVLFKQDYPWEVFFEGHFQPGSDYLLASGDFADVEEKVAWCEDNLDICEEMVRKRHRVVPFLTDPAAMRQSMAEVVRRYEDFYRRHAAA